MIPLMERELSSSVLPDLDLLHNDAEAAAFKKIAESLRQPEDLGSMFTSLQRRFDAEHMAIQAQLKASVESQLGDASRGLNALSLIQSQSTKIIDNLVNLNNLCSNSQNQISNYTRIKKISHTHQNFLATKSMVEQLQQLNERVSMVEKLFADDKEQLVGPAHNMSLVHFHLTELIAFRNKAMASAKSESSIRTLSNYFVRINILEAEHEKYIWQLSSRIIELSKEGYNTTIVKLIKLIETENASDNNGKLVLSRRNSAHDSAITSSKKSYREKFFDVLRTSIVEEINKIYELHQENVHKLLEELNNAVSVLVFVNLEIVPLFPDRYNILHFYVLEYHRAIYDVTSKIINDKLEASVILSLLKWVKEYYDMLNIRLGVSEELLEPRLLDNKDGELTETYIALVKIKLNEWMTNIVKTETNDFTVRKEPPDTDGDMKYILTGSVIVFQMFNQQIDLVSTSSKGKLLYEVVNECCIVLNEYRQKWLEKLDSEFKNYVDKVPGMGEGFPEYSIALANDCFRCIEFTEVLSDRFDTLMDEPYLGKIKATLEESGDGFMDICDRVIKVLMHVISSDLKPAFTMLFTQTWYDKDIMRLIVGTIQDYCDDYKIIANDLIFGKLAAELLEQVNLEYLSSFRKSTSKFKMPQAAEKINSDITTLTDLFTQYRSTNRIATVFSPLRKLVSILECNSRMVLVGFHTLIKEYPDIPYDLMVSIIGHRDDIDKTQAADILEVIKSKIDDQKSYTPTVFSKLLPPSV